MDTIGDAYVVAGFLPLKTSVAATQRRPGGNSGAPQEEQLAEAAQQVCVNLLAVAQNILEVMAAYKRETGRDIQGRIGISAGPVVAGVLGKLQPRFHVYGQVRKNSNSL
jgi:class 3 adenylate cyclase